MRQVRKTKGGGSGKPSLPPGHEGREYEPIGVAEWVRRHPVPVREEKEQDRRQGSDD